MSYERIRVLSVGQQEVNKETGKIYTRVSFQMLVSGRFKVKSSDLVPIFEAAKGADVLVPLRVGVMEDGRQFFVLEDDGLPIPVPSRSGSSDQAAQAAARSSSSGAGASALFSGAKSPAGATATA